MSRISARLVSHSHFHYSATAALAGSTFDVAARGRGQEEEEEKKADRGTTRRPREGSQEGTVRLPDTPQIEFKGTPTGSWRSPSVPAARRSSS